MFRRFVQNKSHFGTWSKKTLFPSFVTSSSSFPSSFLNFFFSTFKNFQKEISPQSKKQQDNNQHRNLKHHQPRNYSRNYSRRSLNFQNPTNDKKEISCQIEFDKKYDFYSSWAIISSAICFIVQPHISLVFSVAGASWYYLLWRQYLKKPFQSRHYLAGLKDIARFSTLFLIFVIVLNICTIPRTLLKWSAEAITESKKSV
jgi:hypothetical protein